MTLHWFDRPETKEEIVIQRMIEVLRGPDWMRKQPFIDYQ